MENGTTISEIERVAIRLEPEASALQIYPHHSRLRRDDLDTSGAFAHLPIFLKSIGGDRIYAFATYELTQSAVFVICSDLHKYPFQFGSTLIEGVLKMELPDTREPFYFSFLGKMERLIDAPSQNEEGPSGFVLKIVQANFDERKNYDLFIEANRSAPSLNA